MVSLWCDGDRTTNSGEEDVLLTILATPRSPTLTRTFASCERLWEFVTHTICVSDEDWTSHTEPAMVTLTSAMLVLNKDKQNEINKNKIKKMN